MSDPTPARPTMGPKRRSRWLDTVTGLLLCVAAGGVLVAAGPSILRAAGLTPPPILVGAYDDQAFAPRQAPQPRPHPFAHSEADDEHSVTELERMYPDGMWSGRGGRPPGERERARTPETAKPGKTRLGLTQKPLTLFDGPGDTGDVLGAVKAGELVMVVKEVGDWVLVVHSAGEDVLMGWVKKSGIAVR